MNQWHFEWYGPTKRVPIDAAGRSRSAEGAPWQLGLRAGHRPGTRSRRRPAGGDGASRVRSRGDSARSAVRSCTTSARLDTDEVRSPDSSEARRATADADCRTWRRFRRRHGRSRRRLKRPLDDVARLAGRTSMLEALLGPDAPAARPCCPTGHSRAARGNRFPGIDFSCRTRLQEGVLEALAQSGIAGGAAYDGLIAPRGEGEPTRCLWTLDRRAAATGSTRRRRLPCARRDSAELERRGQAAPRALTPPRPSSRLSYQSQARWTICRWRLEPIRSASDPSADHHPLRPVRPGAGQVRAGPHR